MFPALKPDTRLSLTSPSKMFTEHLISNRRIQWERRSGHVGHNNNLGVSCNDGSQSHALLRHAIMESSVSSRAPLPLCLERTLFVQERCQDSGNIEHVKIHPRLGNLRLWISFFGLSQTCSLCLWHYSVDEQHLPLAKRCSETLSK